MVKASTAARSRKPVDKTEEERPDSPQQERRYEIEMYKGNRYTIMIRGRPRTIVRGTILSVNARTRNYLVGTGHFRDYVPNPEPDLVPEDGGREREPHRPQWDDDPDPTPDPGLDMRPIGRSGLPPPRGVDLTERGAVDPDRTLRGQHGGKPTSGGRGSVLAEQGARGVALSDEDLRVIQRQAREQPEQSPGDDDLEV